MSKKEFLSRLNYFEKQLVQKLQGRAEKKAIMESLESAKKMASDPEMPDTSERWHSSQDILEGAVRKAFAISNAESSVATPPPSPVDMSMKKRGREVLEDEDKDEEEQRQEVTSSTKRKREEERRKDEELDMAQAMRNRRYGRRLKNFVNDFLLTEEEAAAELKRTYPLPSDGASRETFAYCPFPLLDGSFPATEKAILKFLTDRRELAKSVCAGNLDNDKAMRMLLEFKKVSPVSTELDTLFMNDTPDMPDVWKCAWKGEKEKVKEIEERELAKILVERKEIAKSVERGSISKEKGKELADLRVARSMLGKHSSSRSLFGGGTEAPVTAGVEKSDADMPPVVEDNGEEVVDLLAGVSQPNKEDIIVRLSSIWTVRTKSVPIPKGVGRGSYEIVSIERPIKDDKRGKTFGLSIPLRFLCFFLNAMQKICDSSDYGPTPPPPTADDLRRMKPDEFGVKDATKYSRSKYIRTKFVADVFNIQIRDVEFKNSGPGGNGIYEAICITKTFSKLEEEKHEHPKNKEYSVNIPSRLLGVLKSAIQYIFEERVGTLKK